MPWHDGTCWESIPTDASDGLTQGPKTKGGSATSPDIAPSFSGAKYVAGGINPSTSRSAISTRTASPISPSATRRRTGVLANAACTVDLAASAGTTDGSRVTLTLAVAVDAAELEAATIYGLARDAAGRSTAWQPIGSWNR